MKTKGAALCLLSLLLSAACLAKPPETPSSQKLQIGKKASFIGLAQNEKLGAVVIVEGVGSIYLEGKHSWETEVLNKRVNVTGILDEFDLPVARQDENGAWSQGVTGPPRSAYILKKFTWEKVEEIFK